MYIEEYICFNESTKIATRGVLMYRKKRDLSERREGKVLAIYIYNRMFPKRSQRKNIWKRIWSGGETRRLHVDDTTGYFVGKIQVRFVGTDIHVFGYQARSLRKQLRADELKIFDQFYYERG